MTCSTTRTIVVRPCTSRCRTPKARKLYRDEAHRCSRGAYRSLPARCNGVFDEFRRRHGAGTRRPGVARAVSSSSSVSKAYQFLRLMMDKYARGSTARLVQSFDGGPLRGFHRCIRPTTTRSSSMRCWRKATRRRLARAQVVGNAFLYVQELRQSRRRPAARSYAPKPLSSPATSSSTITQATSATWRGWVRRSCSSTLKRPTAAYLNGALRDRAMAAGQYLRHARRGRLHRRIYGRAARRSSGNPPSTTSTSMRSSRCSRSNRADSEWTAHAAWAKQFVASMWDAKDGRFYVGTAQRRRYPEQVVQARGRELVELPRVRKTRMGRCAELGRQESRR